MSLRVPLAAALRSVAVFLHDCVPHQLNVYSQQLCRVYMTIALTLVEYLEMYKDHALCDKHDCIRTARELVHQLHDTLHAKKAVNERVTDIVVALRNAAVFLHSTPDGGGVLRHVMLMTCLAPGVFKTVYTCTDLECAQLTTLATVAVLHGSADAAARCCKQCRHGVRKQAAGLRR